MSNKLQVSEVQQIPPWVRHFFIHVVKRCCLVIVAWIDEMKEANRDPAGQINQNGR